MRIAVVLLLGLLAAPVSAEEAGRWRATLVGGGAFLGDLREGATAAAIALATPASGAIGAEAELGIVSRIIAPTHRTNMMTTMVSGNLVVEPVRGRRLVPYVTGGGSLLRLRTKSMGAATELGVNAGGGVRYAMTGGRWHLRGDVRFVHVNNAPNFWRALGGVGVEL